MRQLLQNVSTGELTVDEVPAPARGPNSVLVATRFSVISAGTERAVLEIGRASLVGKARQRPDLVKKVVASAKEEGLATTYAKVRGRLGEPNALGYSLSGVVLESCDGASAAPGELVACGGAGHASHAEIVSVPRLLCARVPEGVSAEDAAYATLASIALHGVRLTEVGLGAVVGVVGLGLVGQLTLEIVAAAGAEPLGVDPDPRRVQLARDAGFWATSDDAELEAECARRTDRRGADGVLITAAARSAAPLTTALAVARERSVCCIVGDIAIETPRAPMFAKEIKLVVSRSYGPGRYDPTYESRGIDYPPGYVRWTEGRNLAEVLRLMQNGALRPSRLTSHVFDLTDGPHAYEALESDQDTLGILLSYPGRSDAGPRTVTLPKRRVIGRPGRADRPQLGVIGAGSFARGVLLPTFARDWDIRAVANRTGVSASAVGRRFGARIATTDPAEVISSPEIDAVAVATRHDSHADYASRALREGKHVFVEKPLALDAASLEAVIDSFERSEGVLVVGFNRRFAPLAMRLREVLGGRGPLVMHYRVSAGRLPADHWTHDPEVGGGRIVGEVCHFVDVLTFLTGAHPRSVSAVAVGGGSEPREDSVAATLEFSDGSVGQITYTAFGDPSLAKERLEVLGEGGVGVLDDFRELRLHTSGNEEVVTGKRDKGHDAELAAFMKACRTGVQPWPVQDMAEVMRATFAIRDSVRQPQQLPA